MLLIFTVAEYLGFLITLTAFIVGFSGTATPDYLLPQIALLGIMLTSWGIGGQHFK